MRSSSRRRTTTVGVRVLASLLSVAPCMVALSFVAPWRVAAQDGATGRSHPNAQGGTDNAAIADALFVAARGLMSAERYPEACAKFAESYRLDPASGTLLNLAVCHEHEGKLASAWGEFREAMHEAERAQRPDRMELAREHADALAPELPFLALEVSEDVRVAGLEIVRNGVLTLAGAWAEPLPVDPGRVSIVVRAPGYETQTREVSIAPRQHLTVRVPALLPVVAAEPALVATPAPGSPLVAHEPPRSDTRRRTGIGLIAAGTLIAGVGITASVLTLHERERSDDACPKLDGERRCSQAGVDAMSSARRWALVSDLTVGLGVVGLVAGAYLLLTAPREQRAEPRLVARSALRSPATTLHSRWSWDLAAGPYGARGVVARTF